MATNVASKASLQDSGIDSGMNSIKSPEEAAEVVQGFRSAINALSCERGFQPLVELVDRIPKLEAEIQEKTRILKLTNESIEREKVVQDNLIRKHLSLYKEDIAKVQKQMESLEKKSTGLETSISRKADMIAKLQSNDITLKEGLRKSEDKYRALTAVLKTKDGEITQLQQQCQDNQVKIESLTTELKNLQVEISSKDASLREMSAQHVQLNKAIEMANDQRQEVASYAAPLQDIDSNQLAEEFRRIWVSATALVRRFVEEDLSDNALKRVWTRLNNAAKYVTEQPLPQSNSDIAKELRVIKVLAVLANTIHDYLLQPTYQPPDESITLSQVLYNLACIEPRRENMLRGMLLAALADQRDSAEDQLSEHIVEEVMRSHGIEDVVRPEQHIGFQNELRNMLDDVMDIWYKVQHSTQVFQSSFTPTHGTQVAHFILKTVGSETEDSSRSEVHEDDNESVMLFPTLVLLGKQQIPVTAGTVIRKSLIATLIREEWRTGRVGEPANVPRPRLKSRTLSLSSSARSGRAKEIP